MILSFIVMITTFANQEFIHTLSTLDVPNISSSLQDFDYEKEKYIVKSAWICYVVSVSCLFILNSM